MRCAAKRSSACSRPCRWATAPFRPSTPTPPATSWAVGHLRGRDASVTEAYAYRQVFQHIDLIIFLESTYDPHTRRRYRFISQVLEVTAPDAAASVPYAVNELFLPGPDGRAIPTGVVPTFINDLVREGFDQSLLTTAGNWGPYPQGDRP